MPDPNLSEAIREAYASCKHGVIFHTLEIMNPSFTTPVRIVRDNANLTARLEYNAEYNPGEVVAYTRCPFDVTPPEVVTTGPPQMKIEIDNVGRALMSQIDIAVHNGTQGKTTVTYRQYLQDNLLLGPENDPPMKLTVTQIQATAFKLVIACGYPNFANKRFPGVEYTAEVFPGLIEQ
jgi:hypothetical protein